MRTIEKKNFWLVDNYKDEAMSNVGQKERQTQNRVVKFFEEQLDHAVLDLVRIFLAY